MIQRDEQRCLLTAELGDNGRQKALQALDGLFRKRLVEKIKRSDGKRGTVVVFQPLKERRCS